jgi:hypothetical protein
VLPGGLAHKNTPYNPYRPQWSSLIASGAGCDATEQPDLRGAAALDRGEDRRVPRAWPSAVEPLSAHLHRALSKTHTIVAVIEHAQMDISA